MYAVSRVTGEGRAEFVRTWGAGAGSELKADRPRGHLKKNNH